MIEIWSLIKKSETSALNDKGKKRSAGRILFSEWNSTLLVKLCNNILKSFSSSTSTGVVLNKKGKIVIDEIANKIDVDTSCSIVDFFIKNICLNK